MKNNLSSALTPKQSAVLAYLFETVELGKSVNTLDLGLKGEFLGRFTAGHVKLDENLTLVFTLPTYSDSVFFGLATASPLGTASVLANLEDYEREGGNLQISEAVILPDETARVPGLYAVLLLPPATLTALKAVPYRSHIGKADVKFSLAVPLTVEEYGYRRTHGHDALIDRFESEAKDLHIT